VLKYPDIKNKMLKKIKSKYQEGKLKRAQNKEARREHLYKLHNEPTAFDNVVLSWVAPEAIRHERGKKWKVIMSLLVIVSTVGGIYYNAWTFSLVILTFAFVYGTIKLEHPKDVEVKISEIGIKIGGRKYAFGRIKAFWVIYEPPYVKTLNIRVQGKFNEDITIQLNGQDPSEVREYLLEKIPEMEGQDEKFTDIVLRIFKI